jgi:hypothetical protein
VSKFKRSNGNGMPIDVDDEDEVEQPATAELVNDAPTASRRPRQTDRPTCPVHDVQMTAYATSAMFTYYECPQKGCKETGKRIRPIGPLKNRYGNGTSAKDEAE